MEARFLSRFTPSLMPPKALEAVFVQRGELLQAVLERIRKSALTPEKHNTLLVGPRGIGKTHLISMTYYRLRAMEELQNRIVIAWLREEEWGIACFRDLLIRILRSLPAIEENESARQRLDSLHSLQMKEAELAAAGLIREFAGDRTLVILVENLDDLVRKIGSSGEMQFFQFLSGNHFCCMLATSPGPVSRVLPPGSPFRRNFFHIEQLKELSFEDAIELIRKIALYQDNRELLTLIGTTRGRTRVRALRYLAGGNHRAYVVFAPLLTLESIDRMVEPFMRIIDDLTPYYNSKIAALSMQQRQLIEHICECRHPVRAADVAQSCFLTPVAALTQLEAICTLGHLHSLTINGEKYYELREPLMRLSFEVKKHRGKPITLLLDFLRLWYSPAELKRKISSLASQNAPEQSYIPAVQILEQNWEDPRIAECCREYATAVKLGEFQRALEAIEELLAIRSLAQDSLAQASCLVRLGREEDALAVYDRMISEGQGDASVWQSRAWVLNRAGRYEDAVVSCRKALELDPGAVEALCQEASIFLNLGRAADALRSCEEAIRINDRNILVWDTIGAAFAEMNLFEQSLSAFSRILTLEPSNLRARLHLCASLIELNRWQDALEQAETTIGISPGEPEAWVLKGSALAGMSRCADALEAFDEAVALGEDSSYVQFKRVEMLFVLEHWREGIADLDRALARFAKSENPSVGDTRALVKCLFPLIPTPEMLQLSARLLVLVYRKHGMSGALGQGLVETIPHTVSEKFSNQDALNWCDAWETGTVDAPEFQLPIRLLAAAVRYRSTHDMGVFMSLPQEERTMLQSLLGVHIEAIA